jgi:hypothetical protein
LETYNFEANQEYIKAFASDSHSIMEYNGKKRDSISGKPPSMDSINIAGAGKGTELVTKGNKYKKSEDEQREEQERERKRMDHMSRMHSSSSASSRSVASKTSKKTGPKKAPPPKKSPPKKALVYVQRYDEASGHYYYENKDTGESVWDPPDEDFEPYKAGAEDL